jgi:hypothetical protein
MSMLMQILHTKYEYNLITPSIPKKFMIILSQTFLTSTKIIEKTTYIYDIQ